MSLELSPRFRVPVVAVTVIVSGHAAAVFAATPRPRPGAAAPRPAAAAPRPTAPAPTATPAGLVIRHEEMGCVVAGHFPQFKACFDPARHLAKADMYFRSEKNPAWYRVAFKDD